MAVHSFRFFHALEKRIDGRIFRLFPAVDVFLWCRLINKASFFGLGFELNLGILFCPQEN